MPYNGDAERETEGRSEMEKFRKMLRSLGEDDLVRLAARAMREGCWKPICDAVMDRCNELGGEGMEDAVYDRAWGIAYGC